MLCACGICRKVAGPSGSVNLGGIADSLKINKGKELIKLVASFPSFTYGICSHEYLALEGWDRLLIFV